MMRVRDPVWLDIDFSPKEEAIIRTPTFQRLHRIKQLGNGYHLYPGATHTRFSHSLGVCHLSKVLCAKADIPQEEREEIALAALLHDITHVPFAHTLGGQLGFLQDWDRSTTYKQRFRDLQKEIKLMGPEIVESHQREQLIDLLESEDLISMASAAFSKLDNPYPAELIADSFCADLLDYLRRDVLFCGLFRQYDLRIFDHAAKLTTEDGKVHFGLDITEPDPMNHKRRSGSIVHEYIHLLRVRFDLSERVYFYPSKLAADGLLAKAFRIMLHRGHTIGDKTPADFLYTASDESLVDALSNHPDNDVKYLALKLRDRRLPRCVLAMKGADFTDTQRSIVITTFRTKRNLATWLKIEKEIADKVGIKDTDVLINSLEPEMNLKGADTLVHDEDDQVRILEAHEEIPQAEELQKQHRALWRLYVFSGERDLKTCHKVRDIAEKVLSDFVSDAK